MENFNSKPVYLVDTSSFVVLSELFPIKNWGPIWDFLDLLISEKRLFTIDEVIQELEAKFYDLEVTAWVKQRKDKIKFEYRADHFENLTNVIYPNCPGLSDDTTMTTLHADPLLLTVAYCEKQTLITDERKVTIQPKTNPLNHKLPNHCDALGINYFHDRYAWTKLFNQEGLEMTGFKTDL